MAKKKEEKQIVRLIRKSNELVEARYKFDIWETRIFTKMLTMITRDDEDFKDYRIYLKDVIDEFGLESSNAAYDRLKSGGYKLMSKIVKVVRDTDEGLTEFATPIVVGIENRLNPADTDEARFIDISFHPKMKPFLLTLRSRFTSYDIRNILKLPSTYSVRIYELLKQYEKIGRRKFELVELKEMIGVVEVKQERGKAKFTDYYPLYGNFRQRVLLKSQRDLEKYTDIRFTFEPIKKGRKVFYIQFEIFTNTPSANAADGRSKKKNKKEKISLEKNKVEVIYPNSEFFEELYPKVKRWVGEETFRKWLSLYPVDQIRSGIRYTINRLEKGEQIDNIGGYLAAMVRQTSLFDTVEVKKKEIVTQKRKKENSEKNRQGFQVVLKNIYNELSAKEETIIQQIFIEYPEEREKCMQMAKLSRISNYDPTKTDEENLESGIFSASFKLSVKKKFESRFKALIEEYQPKIEEIKRKISNF